MKEEGQADGELPKSPCQAEWPCPGTPALLGHQPRTARCSMALAPIAVVDPKVKQLDTE